MMKELRKAFCLEDGGSIIFRIVGTHLVDYPVSYPRKPQHEFYNREHLKIKNIYIYIYVELCITGSALSRYSHPHESWHRFAPNFSQMQPKCQ
jgi:hypothetical protein